MGLLRVFRASTSRLLSFPGMLVAVLMTVVVFVCANYKIVADPDIWWHLRDAQLLLSTRSFLRSDIYSFTIHGKPWIDAEWLGELIYYFAWKWLGVRGLFVVVVLAVEAMTLGILWLAFLYSRSVRASLLVCAAFVLLITVSLGPRTLLFGWILFICEMIVLAKFSTGKNHLWLLPVLFGIWVNTHGSWPLGILFLFIYIACGLFSATWGAIETTQWSGPQLQSLVWAAAGSLLALMLNPYGWHAIAYPYQMLFQHKFMVDIIAEWLPLDFRSFRGKLLFGMLALLAGFQLTKGSRQKLHDLIFLFIATYSAFSHSRFLVLAAIVLCPLLAVELAPVPGTATTAKASDKPALNALLILVLLAIVSYRFPTSQQLQQEADDGYPAAALPYLRSMQLQGPLLNYYEWGGYLIWNAPRIPVFIDTMTEAFDREGVFAEYMQILKVDGSLEVMSRYGIRYVLFPKRESLVYLLLHTPGWKVDYDDGQTILLERVVADAKP